MDFLNPVDIGIIIILGFCVIRGLFRGFIKELFSVIAVFGAFYAGSTYYPHAARLILRFVDAAAYVNILSFLILFVGIYVLISLAGILVRKLMNIVFLGWMDRIFGLGFGTIKGILIVAILLMASTTFLSGSETYIKRSRLSPTITRVTEAMARVVPKEMKTEFFLKLEKVKKAWKEIT